jgi:hypothetical protein
LPIRRASPQLKALLLALVATVLLGAVPALASAATFEVNTATDTETISGTPCEEGHQCTLRDAIQLADTPGSAPNTINFAGIPAESVIQVDEAQLPPIEEEVTIDGFVTAGGVNATPAIELVPINFEDGTFPVGLTVIGTSGVRIEGLAFGGWGAGIEIEPNEAQPTVGTEVCGDYLGVKMNGGETNPNEVGIEIGSGPIGEDSEGTVIGSPADGCAGNVISGNKFSGVEDAGFQTTIAGNRIGIGPAGTDGIAMPNGSTLGEGSAGVLERLGARETMVGGTTPGAGEANLIDFNKGAGVKVEGAGGAVAIRGNSISGNEGLGIELAGGGPVSPTLEKAELTSTDELLVEGSVTTTEDETVELEFFGNEACEASGLGQGQTILGAHALAVLPGTTTYSFSLPVNPPVAETGFTATSTQAGGVGATSEFSPCLTENFERTFTVNTLADTTNGGECTVTCSLSDAITLANLTEAPDTIDFAVAGTIAVEPEPLPTINEPLTIDGTTAPGYAGAPKVLLDGTDAFTEGETEGLVVEPEAGGSVIKGLAIGGFDYGVYLTGAVGSQLCSSWIGVELDGTTPLPNEYGVETGTDSTGNRIGAGCGSEGGELISANREWGIRDFGLDTVIAAGRVGVDAAGGPLPNGTNRDGGGGIQETESAAGALIGGGGNPPNVIADNVGPGVGVQSAASHVKIRGNSIFGNEEPGIQIGDGGTEAPTIESVAVGTGTVSLTGEATAGDGPETIELDFYATEACGPGEGRTYLGSATVANTTGGAAGYVTGPIAAAIPAGQNFITATATGSELGQTTEFSACFEYEPPPPVAIVTAPPASTEASAATFEFAAVGASGYECSLDGAAFGLCTSPASFGGLAVGPHTFAVRAMNATGEAGVPTRYEWTVAGPPPPQKSSSVAQDLPAGNPPPSGPEPTNGEKVVVAPVKGKVRIKLPGTNKYVSLQELKEIPVGAVIDATKGRVQLTSRNPDGTEQTAEFFEGVFRVKQRTGAGLVVLELLDTRTCPAPGATGRATASSLALRPAGAGTAGKLWGSGHGNFRTEGNDGSATVRGTIWLVEDRCNGTTFFKTRRDVVTVRDFITGKTFSLREGRTYLAGP